MPDLHETKGTLIYIFSESPKKVGQVCTNFIQLSGRLDDCGRTPSRNSSYSILKLCCTNHSYVWSFFMWSGRKISRELNNPMDHLV